MLELLRGGQRATPNRVALFVGSGMTLREQRDFWAQQDIVIGVPFAEWIGNTS